MIKEQYQTLFTFSSHTSQRLLDRAALLEERDYHENPGYGHGSIHDLFFHLMITLRRWRIGLTTGSRPVESQPQDYTTLLAVSAALDQEYSDWQRFIGGLSDEEIFQPLVVVAPNGARDELIYWRAFQHLVLHAMQHHTEIAKLLTDKGQSPGDLDFVFYEG